MNKRKYSNTLTELMKLIKISLIILLCIIILHEVFSKPVKDVNVSFETDVTGRMYIETSCEFYENELQITQ